MARQFLIAIIIAVLWSLASVVTMTYGILLNWPDYVHVNYGFPLPFATHTLNTFAGPVDKWNLDLIALVADLSFWFLGMMVIVVGLAYSQSRIKNR